jgi:hypothetical protein
VSSHQRHFLRPSLLLGTGALIVLGLIGITFITSPWWSPLAEKVHRKIRFTLLPATSTTHHQQVSKPVDPPPLPDRFYPQARMMTLPLAAGLDIRLNIVSAAGQTASVERENPDAYALDTTLTYRVPRAAVTLSELGARNTALAQHWPHLETLLTTARISPYYHSLYQRKQEFLSMRIDHIREIPRRHNMYDCDTILELTSADGSAKGLLIQADMDIVTDGSDSDRTLEVDASSPTFQPFTSYNWAKRTSIVNPLKAPFQQEAAALKTRLAQENLSTNERYIANRRLRFLSQSLEALKYRSSLVAALDPFIVVPVFMTKTGSTHQPQVGDYCVVFYRDLLLPAIVGDTGPNSKIGEASLKLAQKIDPTVSGSARSRPVSTLGVTYLIFPGTAAPKMGPPDLDQWQQACQKYFAALGGDPQAIQSWSEHRHPAPAYQPDSPSAGSDAGKE